MTVQCNDSMQIENSNCSWGSALAGTPYIWGVESNEDTIKIIPQNSGFLIEHVSNGVKLTYAFSSYDEVIRWISEHPILSRDESKAVENI
jgi:hypothetical protein